jgi:hypothetical protein
MIWLLDFEAHQCLSQLFVTVALENKRIFNSKTPRQAWIDILYAGQHVSHRCYARCLIHLEHLLHLVFTPLKITIQHSLTFN